LASRLGGRGWLRCDVAATERNGGMLMSNSNTRTVTLILTEACNLSCAYCFEHNKSGKTMSAQTAKAIVDAEFAALDADGVLLVDFFGGEPFLEFETVREIFDHACGLAGPDRLRFTATTNGTLVHGTVQEWLRENRDRISCSVSVDGTRAMQELNRPGSFDSIDLDFFRRTWPDTSVKMTVSAETIGSLAEGVIYLHDQGFRVNCNLGYGIRWSIPEHVDALERELGLLVDYYLSHPHVEPCAILDMNVEYVGAGITSVSKWCGAGSHMVAYAWDGSSYPCHSFAPISVGPEKAADSLLIDFAPQYDVSELDPLCQGCILVACCPNCYGTSFGETRSIFSKQADWCELMKTVFRANSYLRYRQLAAGQLDVPEEDARALLEGISLVQRELC